MKRSVRVLFAALVMMLLVSTAAYAAPQGYMEVNLTKKNVKKYFQIKKAKSYTSTGDYNGYYYILASKLVKKGYYVYKDIGFSVKGTAKVRYKYKSGKKTYKNSYKVKFTIPSAGGYRYGGSSTYNYKYGKYSKTKFKKASGTVIFVEPSNVIGITPVSNSNGSLRGYAIEVRYPYDASMPYYTSRDANGNIVRHYYIARSAVNYNPEIFF